jgi:PAS domain S-box-containing protein
MKDNIQSPFTMGLSRSNLALRMAGAVSLVSIALAVGGYSFTRVLAPEETMVGRGLGGLAVLGISLPLVAGGLWILTSDRLSTDRATLRILGWCGFGMAPVTVFGMLFILYQRQHGVVLTEPIGVLLWIIGGGTIGGLITGIYDVRRRQAYRRQQEAVDRLSGLIDTAPVPIIEHDLDGTVHRWNDAAERIFGWSAEEAIGNRLPFLSETDESEDEFSDLQDRLLDGEQLNNVEIRRQTKDGEERDFLLSTATVSDETEDSPTSIIGVLVDVTQQKRQRKKLELFRSLLDHSNDSIFLVETESGGFVDVNETACERLGYDREELIELSVTDVEKTLSTKKDWRGHLETIREEGSVLYEGRQERKDGSTFPVEVNIAHVVLEEEYTVAIARDITKRKERTRELTQFQKAVEHAGYAIYLTDRDGTIEYVNPAFENITGYSADDAVGSDPSILQSGEQDTEYYQRLWRTILDGRIWEEEIINQRRSGERYTAYQTIAPIYDDDSIVGFVAIQRDSTAKHLRTQRVSVLNRVLRHNLKNAVNVISGHADLLREELEEPEQLSYLNKIDDQAQTLESLSETAQNVTKALDNTRPPRNTTSVNDILEQVVQPFRDENTNAEITIEADTVREKVDASIKPALQELLENGLKHTENPHPVVKLSARTIDSGKQVSITVTDDGPGIPDLDRQTISRDAPEEPLRHSDGMGLWLVKWVTTALGGTVEITDNDLEGSTVTLTVPVISESGDDSSSQTGAGTSGPEYAQQKRRIKNSD